jgi:predicted DNA-binding transcriptional regulator AlpA
MQRILLLDWVIPSFSITTQPREVFMSELIDVRSAAELLGLSRSYIYKLRGAAPGIYKFGRGLRINPRELASWARSEAELEAKKTAGAAPKAR